MKVKKFIKALYFANPEKFGFRPNEDATVAEVWRDVIRDFILDVELRKKVSVEFPGVPAWIDSCAQELSKYVERYYNQ